MNTNTNTINDHETFNALVAYNAPLISWNELNRAYHKALGRDLEFDVTSTNFGAEVILNVERSRKLDKAQKRHLKMLAAKLVQAVIECDEFTSSLN